MSSGGTPPSTNADHDIQVAHLLQRRDLAFPELLGQFCSQFRWSAQEDRVDAITKYLWELLKHPDRHIWTWAQELLDEMKVYTSL